MIISIHDIGRNGRGAHYEWLRANAGGEIYSPDLEYGRYSPLATFERLRSRLSMYEKTTPEGEPYFLSVMIGTASEDAPTYALEVKRYLESRNDGRRYVFVRTADLAATYRAWKGLPVM